MNTKPRVLIIEDNESAQDLARIILEPYATVIIAASIHAALRELRADPVFFLVILDGRVPHYDSEPLRNADTTLQLAKLITGIHKIPAYAASSCEDLNSQLAKIGCIHTNKLTAVKEAKKALLAFMK